MPLPIDYHNHPQGHRVIPYTQELLQPWADAARARGLKQVAFTDHDRYKEGIRFDAVEKLNELNPDMTFLSGLELDNDPKTGSAGRAWVEENWDKLDFVLGSAHYLSNDPEMFDEVPLKVSRRNAIDPRNMEKECFNYIAELDGMIQRGGIDCMAHLDLIKIHGLWKPEGGLLPFFKEILGRIKKADLAIEISTAGWRKPVGEQYPHFDLIQEALSVGIPLTLASDAHSFAQLADEYLRLEELLRKWGVTHIATYKKHKRTLIPL
jgi:histidinol-phosphatase (PHP family)